MFIHSSQNSLSYTLFRSSLLTKKDSLTILQFSWSPGHSTAPRTLMRVRLICGLPVFQPRVTTVARHLLKCNRTLFATRGPKSSSLYPHDFFLLIFRFSLAIRLLSACNTLQVLHSTVKLPVFGNGNAGVKGYFDGSLSESFMQESHRRVAYSHT